MISWWKKIWSHCDVEQTFHSDLEQFFHTVTPVRMFIWRHSNFTVSHSTKSTVTFSLRFHRNVIEVCPLGWIGSGYGALISDWSIDAWFSGVPSVPSPFSFYYVCQLSFWTMDGLFDGVIQDLEAIVSWSTENGLLLNTCNSQAILILCLEL
jgi:hypothetical protein